MAAFTALRTRPSYVRPMGTVLIIIFLTGIQRRLDFYPTCRNVPWKTAMTDNHRARTTYDRRTLLKAATAATALGTVVGTAGASHQEQFDTVRKEVVQPYETDPERATADGFEIGGPYVPDMGWHFLNQDNVNSAVLTGFDVTEPQVLVYADERFVPDTIAENLTFDEDTGLRLGAVEYAIPVGARGHTEENPPDIFNDEEHEDLETTEAEGWHVHPKAEHAFLTDEGKHVGFQPDGDNEGYWEERTTLGNWLELVPGGNPVIPDLSAGEEVIGHLAGGGLLDSKVVVSSIVHPDLLTLHVWLGIENPDGVFAGHNHALDDSGHDGHDH